MRLTPAAIDIDREDVSKVYESKELTEKNRIYLNKIIDLAQEEDIMLILLKSPLMLR